MLSMHSNSRTVGRPDRNALSFVRDSPYIVPLRVALVKILARSKEPPIRLL